MLSVDAFEWSVAVGMEDRRILFPIPISLAFCSVHRAMMSLPPPSWQFHLLRDRSVALTLV